VIGFRGDFAEAEMALKRLLCHVCCAQCYLGALPVLGREAEQVEGFFYNPNIMPLLEFRRRLKGVETAAEQLKVPVHFERGYGMEEFLRRVAGLEAAGRHRMCMVMRLKKAAEYAREHGFDAFTTSLLVSKHQLHEEVREAGEEVAKDLGVPFLYVDMRGQAEAGHAEAKRRHLYLQQYCGCVYSEYERYKDAKFI